MSITDQSFDILSTRLKQISGITLARDKTYLLESRLNPVIRKHEIATIDDFAAEIAKSAAGPLVDELIDVMTTNETFFFRDNTPFNNFRESILPKFLESRANKKQIKIWCGAASTGQEPYSLCMILKELGPKVAGWDIPIIGTDLCVEALEKAKAATYTQFEVQRGMPIQMLMKYFTQDGERWKLNDEIKSMVKFGLFNLMNDPKAVGMGFDIVFLRNVLIYFDVETKKKVLEGISKIMPSDGVIFLGGAETVLGVTKAFEPYPDLRGVYRQSQAEAEKEVPQERAANA